MEFHVREREGSGPAELLTRHGSPSHSLTDYSSGGWKESRTRRFLTPRLSFTLCPHSLPAGISCVCAHEAYANTHLVSTVYQTHRAISAERARAQPSYVPTLRTEPELSCPLCSFSAQRVTTSSLPGTPHNTFWWPSRKVLLGDLLDPDTLA